MPMKRLSSSNLKMWACWYPLLSFILRGGNWRVFERLLRRILSHEVQLGEQVQADTQAQLGRVYLHLGDKAGARKELLAALGLRPTHEEALAAMRDLSFEEERWDDAFRFGRAFLDEHGAALSAHDRAEQLYRLGSSRELVGAIDDARACFTECLEYFPNHEGARRALGDGQGGS